MARWLGNENVRCCPGCRYNLEGLPGKGAMVRCPECGVEHKIADLLPLPPWPSMPRICLYLGGPTLVLSALTVVTWLVYQYVISVAFLYLTLVSAIVAPLTTAKVLVPRHARERDQDSRFLHVVLSGYLLDFLIAVGWFALLLVVGWLVQGV